MDASSLENEVRQGTADEQSVGIRYLEGLYLVASPAIAIVYPDRVEAYRTGNGPFFGLGVFFGLVAIFMAVALGLLHLTGLAQQVPVPALKVVMTAGALLVPAPLTQKILTSMNGTRQARILEAIQHGDVGAGFKRGLAVPRSSISHLRRGLYRKRLIGIVTHGPGRKIHRLYGWPWAGQALADELGVEFRR